MFVNVPGAEIIDTCTTPEKAEEIADRCRDELKSQGLDKSYRVFWLAVDLGSLRPWFRVFVAKNC